MPGAKDLLTSAIMAGGAFPHRLGLSETVLVFENHMEFMGGFDAFVEQLPSIKSKCIEKKLFVEANAEQARTLARVSAGWEGVDGVQLDKVPVEQLASLVAELREIDPRLTLIGVLMAWATRRRFPQTLMSAHARNAETLPMPPQALDGARRLTSEAISAVFR